jgi:hypothetical protein
MNLLAWNEFTVGGMALAQAAGPLKRSGGRRAYAHYETASANELDVVQSLDSPL